LSDRKKKEKKAIRGTRGTWQGRADITIKGSIKKALKKINRHLT